MKNLRLVPLFLLIGHLAVAGEQTAVFQTPLGAEVELRTAAFEPGQIVVARLVRASAVKKVVVRFRGDTYELGFSQEGLEPFALIGLDLDLKPGPYSLRATVYRKDGEVEEVDQSIRLTAREFAVKKLRVKEQFVTPPLEVAERIQREMDLLTLVYSVVTNTWLGESGFMRPHEGNMASNFGEKRIYNNVPRSTHAGVDVTAPLGSPVRAANSGRVVLARDLYFSGRTVIIDHGLGVFTFYCHFSELRVKRGQMVKKGDLIALAGSTGRSTGPHLHWGVRIHENRVDPAALLNVSVPGQVPADNSR